MPDSNAGSGKKPPLRLDDPAWIDEIVAGAVRRVTAGEVDAVAHTSTPTASVEGEASTAPATSTPTVSVAVDQAAGADAAGTPIATINSKARGYIEWAAVIVGSLLVAILVKTFLLQAFYIPSASMEPTLHPQDRVLVNKLSYELHDVNRGDLIVFGHPEEVSGEDTQDLIKRVIGLPGETVELRENSVLIDGQPLDEPYLPEGTTFSDFGPVQVPEGHVFVLGDNRAASRDSRVFDSVPIDDIVGRAFFRIWPPSRIGFL